MNGDRRPLMYDNKWYIDKLHFLGFFVFVNMDYRIGVSKAVVYEEQQRIIA